MRCQVTLVARFLYLDNLLWKRRSFAFANNKRKNMGFGFAPECNHAQESHTCISIISVELQKFCYHGNMKKRLFFSIIMPAAVWSSTISFLSLGACSTYRRQLSKGNQFKLCKAAFRTTQLHIVLVNKKTNHCKASCKIMYVLRTLLNRF